jgi:hypothetical protein
MANERLSEKDIEKLSTMSELELSAYELPWIRTRAELNRVLSALAKRGDDYGTTVYAMSIAAHATFMYMSHVCGATGFQAGCADLDFLRRSRRYEHPFGIRDYGNLLYPQYMDEEHFPSLDTLLDKNAEWLSREAAKLLASGVGVPRVQEHWKWLVSRRPPSSEREL